MSTNTRINLVATALVAALFALGAAFGYLALGGQPTPTNAVVPAQDGACLLCADTESVGGAGNVGGQSLGQVGSIGGSGGRGHR